MRSEERNLADKLVSVAWVAEHGGDAGVRLVEVDVDTEAYAEGHIAGAVGWSWTTQLQDQTRRDVIAGDALEALLGQSGITNDTHVVLYGDNSNWFAAYALWLLELYGHDAVSLMDGGRVKWLADGRPLTAVLPVLRRTTYAAKAANRALRAKRNDVVRALEDDTTQFIDVRSPLEFSGEVIAPPGVTETAQRGGHIPGAKNIPWARAVHEDGRFRTPDELRAVYAAAGLRDGAPMITYCRIGERSSHTWFVLRYLLGLPDVRNYDGSWSEYGSLIDVPIER